MNKTINPKRVYTYKEVQTILGITKYAAASLMKSGRLKPVLIGQQYRFLGQSVIDFLYGGERPTAQ